MKLLEHSNQFGGGVFSSCKRALHHNPPSTWVSTPQQRNWFSGKILRCHSSNVGEPWVRFPDYALDRAFETSGSFLFWCCQFLVVLWASRDSPVVARRIDVQALTGLL